MTYIIFPESLVYVGPHLNLGQSSGCWIRDELDVGDELLLAPKSCWAAICTREKADEPFWSDSSRLGVW